MAEKIQFEASLPRGLEVDVDWSLPVTSLLLLLFAESVDSVDCKVFAWVDWSCWKEIKETKLISSLTTEQPRIID
jgi:hypothetical protein